MKGLLFVAAQAGVVFRREQHYVVAPMIGDDHGLALCKPGSAETHG